MVASPLPVRKRSPLGEPPIGWELFRLGDLALKVGSGATPSGGSEVYLSERHNYALIRSQNVYDRHFDETGLVFIEDEHARQLQGATVRSGDVLLNITGDGITFGRACIAPDQVLPACVNQHVSIIRVNSTLADPGYILAYLTHPLVKNYIESFNAGGSRRAITKGHIESFIIPLPPLSEQRSIAGILGALDEKIELNRKMNTTLEEMAHAIFLSWFVDFDPVHAKAEGRAPAGMDAATAALFPDAFAEIDGRAVPRGWNRGTIGEEFDLTMGQSPPGDTYNDIGEGLPFFQGRADFGFRYPSRRVYCTAPTRIANVGDTLVSVRAPVGDINMAAEKCCVGRGVAALRHKSRSRSYTYYAVHSLQDKIASFEAEGTIFGSINKLSFERIRCLAAPPLIIQAFENVSFSLDQTIENNERQTHTLTTIRDSLLPKLLSGELRVREAEQLAESVL